MFLFNMLSVKPVNKWNAIKHYQIHDYALPVELLSSCIRLLIEFLLKSSFKRKMLNTSTVDAINTS